MKGKVNVFCNPCAPLPLSLLRCFRLVLQYSIPCSNRFSFLYLLVMLEQLGLLYSDFIWGENFWVRTALWPSRAVLACFGKKKKKKDVLGIILDTGMRTLFVSYTYFHSCSSPFHIFSRIFVSHICFTHFTTLQTCMM